MEHTIEIVRSVRTASSKYFATAATLVALILVGCGTTPEPMPAQPPPPAGMVRIDVVRDSAFVGSVLELMLMDASEPNPAKHNAALIASEKGRTLVADEGDFGASLYMPFKGHFLLVSGAATTQDQIMHIPAQAPDLGDWVLSHSAHDCRVIIPDPEGKSFCNVLVHSGAKANTRFLGLITNGNSISWTRPPGEVRVVALLGRGHALLPGFGFGPLPQLTPVWAFEVAKFEAKPDHAYRVDFTFNSRRGTVVPEP